MSKRRITSIAVATLCLFAVGIAPHWTEPSVGATLSERWSSLRGAFKKDSSQAQASQSSSRNTAQRSTRTGYGKNQHRRTTANNNSRARTSSAAPAKKSGLSSLVPSSLFGNKKQSQNVANNRQNQTSKQQQTNSQNRSGRNNKQVASQKRNRNSANSNRKVVTDLPQIVENRKAPIATNARKSPTTDRRDELQDALSDLVDGDDLLPGSVIVDSEETVVDDNDAPAPGAAVLALDDYGAEIIEDASVGKELAGTAIAEESTEVDTESFVVEHDSSATEDFIEVPAEEIVVESVEEEATIAQTAPAAESHEVIGNLPLPEQTAEQDYSLEAEEEADYAVVEEEIIYEPSSQEVASDNEQEVPFGQADLDVHDALLSEDLYAMPEEVEETHSTGAPAEDGFASEQIERGEDVAELAPVAEEIAEALPIEPAPLEEPTSVPEESVAAQPVLEAIDPLEEPRSEQQSELAVEVSEPETEQPVTEVDAFASLSELAAESQAEVQLEPEPQEVFASDSNHQNESQQDTSPRYESQSSDQFADVVDTLESQPRFTATNPRESGQVDASSKPQPKMVRQDIKSSKNQEIVGRQHKPATRLIRPRGDVLTTTEQPVIMSHVEGPRSILVGKEASYRVVLENTSQTEAQNLSASVKVPEWADLVDVVCSAGIVEQSRDDNDADVLQWHLPQLGAHSSQTMQLQLIPRSGRAFQLGVQWKQETATTETVVEVKEPKLQMVIEGPEDVLFGDPKRYRLVLKNPGNGPAENVALTLIPPGSDSISAKPHVIGTLGPSEVKEIEIELTARETGELILQANAEASGDLKCEVIKRVQCRRPELEVDWRGPEQKYAGTESAYYFRVHNPGSARTGNVDVKVRLPAGIKFLSASDSFSYDATSGLVTWRLEGLRPNEEQFMQFRCELERPGLKEFEVEATSQGGLLSDAKWVRTEVVALADLKLDVRDPRGAHPTGEPVTYEIRVENRGTTDAEGISIVGLFSEGIDPVSVEGAQSSVRDGRVNFQTVKTLPPGGEILLKIRAIASDVGTHVFRAEVSCHDLDIKLAAEETTRFFKDDFQWGEGETPYTASRVNSTRSR